MVGNEHDALFLRCIPYLNTPQGRIVLPRIVDVEGNQLIIQDRPVSWNRPFFYDRIVGIPFLPADEPDALLLPPGKEGIIHITPVHDDNGSLGEGEALGNLRFVGKSIGDMGENREITVVIKEQMELDGPLGLAIGSPVKKRDTQFDQGSIKAEEFVSEAELLLSRGNHPALLQQLIEDCLIEPEGSFFIGIGEGGTRGALSIPRCLSFPRQLAETL
jgi:hypothetical protein